jgi:hypothetical protein
VVEQFDKRRASEREDAEVGQDLLLLDSLP